MTSLRLRARAPAAALVFASFATGCDEGQIAPPFPEGQGQAPGGGVAYPAGPYGTTKGDVIQNFKFLGLVNPEADSTSALEIELADFYNPTGDGVYEEGSIFDAGVEKPKLLLLNVSASWCQPCQHEADKILPGKYAKYHPYGAQFLLLLAEGPNQGEAAEFKNLVTWTNRYETLWPGTIDPNYTLASIFKATAYPVNILIDTETMRIVEAVAGAPEEEGPVFQALDELLE